MLHCLSHKHEILEDSIVIDVTSRSSSFGRMLSPFNVGPVELYDGYSALNIENGYQFASIHSQFINEKNEPTESYWDWAMKGWGSRIPIKYPLGAWSKPSFHWWKGRRLNRLEAQNEIFVPLYKEAVMKTNEFKILKDLYQKSKDDGTDLVLLCFEGYDHRLLEIELRDVFNHPDYPVGQGFVLMGILEGVL